MKWWTLKDDGASATCSECKKEEPSLSKLILTETPGGSKLCFHKECVDEDWLKRAVYQGVMK